MSASSAKKYLLEDEWDALPQDEQKQLSTKLPNYLELQQPELKKPPPDFVLDWEAREKSKSHQAQEVANRPSKKTTVKKRKQPAAAGPSDSGKRSMLVQNMQAAVKNMNIVKEHINAADKLRALQQTMRHEFHGFSAQEIARSQAVAARLKALLKVLEAQFDLACMVYDKALEAVRLEVARNVSHREVDLDKEQAATSAASASNRQLTKDLQEETQEQQGVITEPRYPLCILCDRCQLEHQGVCPTHGKLQFVAESRRPMDFNKPDRAEDTLPKVLTIRKPRVKDSGVGVWARVALPQGVLFGPYEGRLTRIKDIENPAGYNWIIKRASKGVAELDPTNRSISNWMRFVNCTTNKDEQNITSFQFQGQLFYRTMREVPAHCELLVYYSDTFTSKRGIRNIGCHRGSVSLAPPVVFSCRLCKTGFTSSIRRDRHQRLFCRRRRFQPKNLKKVHSCVDPLPKTPADLEAIAQFNKAGSEGRKRFICSVCAYSTDKINHFKRHITTHTSERIFACTHCEFKTNTKDSLARHALIHGDVKPFACTACNYRTLHKTHLKRHIRVHTLEKPYKCIECDLSFNHKTNLIRHVRSMHTKEHPYACTQCTYTCVTGSNLTRHMRTHTKEKKLSCSECVFKCNDARNLQNHMCSKHGAAKKLSCSLCDYKCNQIWYMKKHVAGKHED